MSNKVKIILLEDINSLGKTGDIVSTSEGYARNFLFPQGKAALATDQVTKQADAKKQEQTKQIAEQAAKLQQQADSLNGTELTFTERIKDGTQIFGSITAAKIAKELNQQADLSTKASDIELPKPLTETGSADITVSLSPDVETTIRVTIESDPASLAKDEDDE